MSDAFHLQIISPSAVMVDAHVPMVQVPGTEGDFGVLPNHAPFFSMIRPGVIDVTTADGHHRRFFAASGYADVSSTQCTILSDHIQDLSDISQQDVAEALAAARQALVQAGSNPAEQAAAQKLIATAEALALAVGNR